MPVAITIVKHEAVANLHIEANSFESPKVSIIKITKVHTKINVKNIQ